MVYTNHCCYHDTAPITVTMKTRTVLAVLEPKVGMYQNENAKVSKACQLCYITIRSLQGLLRVPLLRFGSTTPPKQSFCQEPKCQPLSTHTADVPWWTGQSPQEPPVNRPRGKPKNQEKTVPVAQQVCQVVRRFATDKGSSKLWLIRHRTQDFSNGILQVTIRKNNLRNLDVGQLTHSPEHVLSLSRINATWVPRNRLFECLNVSKTWWWSQLIAARARATEHCPSWACNCNLSRSSVDKFRNVTSLATGVGWSSNDWVSSSTTTTVWESLEVLAEVDGKDFGVGFKNFGADFGTDFGVSLKNTGAGSVEDDAAVGDDGATRDPPRSLSGNCGTDKSFLANASCDEAESSMPFLYSSNDLPTFHQTIHRPLQNRIWTLIRSAFLWFRFRDVGGQFQWIVDRIWVDRNSSGVRY